MNLDKTPVTLTKSQGAGLKKLNSDLISLLFALFTSTSSSVAPCHLHRQRDDLK